MRSHPTRLVRTPAADLRSDELQALEDHVVTCAQCTHELEELRAAETLIGLREAAIAVHPLRIPERASFPRSVVRIGGAVVALAFALVLGSTVGGLLGDRREHPGPAAALLAAGDVRVLRAMVPDPPRRVVGTSPGEDAPDFEWDGATGVARLSDLRGREVMLLVWQGQCACEGIVEEIAGQPAPKGVQPQLVMLVQETSPDRLESLAQKYPDAIVIADPEARSAARYDARAGIVTLILSSEGRTARVLSAATSVIPFRIMSALAQARGMSEPPIVGTIVEVRGPLVLVDLESPTMSAQYGRPARFHAGASTAYKPTVSGLSELGLKAGDRVRLSWADDLDAARDSYLILTIGRE